MAIVRSESSLTITLNGESFVIEKALSIAELLALLKVDPRLVAVEHNVVVVKRDRYATTMIQPGDEIEIVNFVGGG